MKRRITLLMMFFLAYASGCAAPPKRDVPLAPEPDVRTQIAPLPSIHTIDKKISFLDGMLAKEDLSEEDRRIATDLLATYKLTKKLAPDHLTTKEYQSLIHSLFRSGSTYLWNKFRGNKNYHCYYEIYQSLAQNLNTLG